MKRSIVGSGFLVVAFALVGAGCSGDQSLTNANSTTNANTISTSSNAGNANATGSNTTAEKRGYPAEVAEEFMKSCEESGSPKEFCTCMFEKIQQQYSFEEFSTIETKISAGEPPEEFVEFTGKARTECSK